MTSRTVLTESVWQALNEDTQNYLTEWDQLGLYLQENADIFEAELTPQQINDIFTNAEQYAVDSGSFQTKLGKVGNKAADAGKAAVGGVKVAANVMAKANAQLNKLGAAIQDTTPIKGIDAAFEKAKKDLYVKLGGKDSKVNQVIMKASQLAKDHPGKTKFLVGALTVAASLAAGPAGGAAAGYILRGASDLIAGEKLSTAVGKGLKTAAMGYLSGKAIEWAKDAFQSGASPEQLASIANDPKEIAGAIETGDIPPVPRGTDIRQLSMQGRMMDLQDMNDTMKDVGGQMGLKPPFEATFKMGVPTEINGVPVPQDILSGVDPVIPGQNFAELRKGLTGDAAGGAADAAGGAAGAAADAGSAINIEDIPIKGNGKFDDLSDAFLSLSSEQQAVLYADEMGLMPSPEFAQDLINNNFDPTVMNNKILNLMQQNSVNPMEYYKELRAVGQLDDTSNLYRRMRSSLERLQTLGILDNDYMWVESIDVDKHNALYETAKLKYMSGMLLTETEQQVLDEGPLDAIKKGAAKAASAVGGAVAKGAAKVAQGAKSAGRELGQQVTAKKLNSLWKNAGAPTDAPSVSSILAKAGLDSQGISAVSTASKVELPAPAPAATPAAATPAAATPAAGQAAAGQAAAGQAAAGQAAATAGPKKQGAISKIGKAIGGMAKGAVAGAKGAAPAPAGQAAPAPAGQAAPAGLKGRMQGDLDDMTKARAAAGLDNEPGQKAARGAAPDAKGVVQVKPKAAPKAKSAGPQSSADLPRGTSFTIPQSGGTTKAYRWEGGMWSELSPGGKWQTGKIKNDLAFKLYLGSKKNAAADAKAIG